MKHDESSVVGVVGVSPCMFLNYRLGRLELRDLSSLFRSLWAIVMLFFDSCVRESEKS